MMESMQFRLASVRDKDSTDCELEGHQSLRCSPIRQWGQREDGGGVKPSWYAQCLPETGWVESSALNWLSELGVPLNMVLRELTVGRVEAELQACCSVPVNINDAFCCCWGVVSFMKEALFSGSESTRNCSSSDGKLMHGRRLSEGYIPLEGPLVELGLLAT